MVFMHARRQRTLHILGLGITHWSLVSLSFLFALTSSALFVLKAIALVDGAPVFHKCLHSIRLLPSMEPDYRHLAIHRRPGGRFHYRNSSRVPAR
jgi:hypothetical protein